MLRTTVQCLGIALTFCGVLAVVASLTLCVRGGWDRRPELVHRSALLGTWFGAGSLGAVFAVHSPDPVVPHLPMAISVAVFLVGTALVGLTSARIASSEPDDEVDGSSGD